MSVPIPARLHVVLARAARTAVVIRRGPSRHVAVIGWNLDTNRFTLGQWMYGRIYERRCDLSPDGKHFLYFAMNGRWGTRVKGSWSAISRAPYLKAMALWAKGDCWHGGGLFLSAKKYWLNDGYGHEPLQDDTRLVREPKYPWHEGYGGECPSVYYIRLQRDGWAMRYNAPDGAGGHVALFEKRIAGHWRLRKLAHATIAHPVGRGCYFDEHALWNARTEETVALPQWEWADLDAERILWAQDGVLFAGKLDGGGLRGTRRLFDFNPLHFERLQAPY